MTNTANITSQYILAYKCTIGLTASKDFTNLTETIFPKLKDAKTALRKANSSLRKNGLGLGVFKTKIVRVGETAPSFTGE